MSVREIFRLHDDADLAAGLDGVGFLHALEGIRRCFELLKPFEVALKGLTPDAGPSRRQRVRRGNKHRFNTVRLAVAVVRHNGIDDLGVFAVLLGKVSADLRVRAFDFMVDRFPEVMEQACPPRQLLVHAALGSHHTRKVGHLTRMHEHVLSVARPEPEPPQELDDFGVDIVEPQVEGRLLALVLHGDIQVFLDLFRDLLDARRVNAAVQDQTLNGKLGDLPAERVIAGKDHGLGRIVDDKIDAGGCLERADVPSLAADDPAFHFVVGQVHHRHSGLRHIVAGVPLNGEADDVLGFFVGLVLGFVLDTFDALGRLVLGFVLHGLHELALRFFTGHTRDLFKQLALFAEPLVKTFFFFDGGLFPRRKLAFAADGICLPLVHHVDLFFKVLFLLGQPPLLVLQLLPFVAVLLFELGARLIQFVLDLQHGLLAFGLGLALRVHDNAGRFGFRVPDLSGCGFSFDHQAEAEARGKSCDQYGNIVNHARSSCCLFFSPARRSLVRFSSPCSVGW